MLALVLTAAGAAQFYTLCFCIAVLMTKAIYEGLRLYSKFKEKK
jgi:hypothetical protein